jgi:hypothetical protein
MQQSVDPKNLFGALHFEATGELLQLMDGFYSNIEDGLFEVAYANDNQNQQRHVIELMRELRVRRKHLIKAFGKRMQTAARGWIAEFDEGPEYHEERALANLMSQKCAAHFGGLLQSIAERTAHAADRDMDKVAIPVSPQQVSYHFVMSCRSLKFDKYSIETVQTLFARFVLDRLGNVYGNINNRLQEAGFLTMTELEGLVVNSQAG